MFGKALIEGLFGEGHQPPAEFCLAVGQRLGRRCHYGATRLQVMQWMSEKNWLALRGWMLKDLPGEEPLPRIDSISYEASGVPVLRAVYCDMQGKPLWTDDPYSLSRMEGVGDYVNKFMIPYRVRRVAVCEGTMYVNLEEEQRP